MVERPSGWFDDPDDDSQLRYFDGVVWTAHTAAKRPPRATADPDGAGDPWRQPGQWAGGHGGLGGPGGHAGGPGEQRPRPGEDRGWHPAGTAVHYAGWWRRVAAYLVDLLLVSLLAAPFLASRAERVSTALEGLLDRYLAAAAGGGAPPTIPPQLAEDLLTINLVQVGLFLVYEVGLLAWRGATLGRTLVGIRVESAAGGKARPAHLVRRTVVKGLSNILGTLPVLSFVALLFQVVDYLWPLRDPRRQALHDKVGDTVVVRGRGPVEDSLRSTGERPGAHRGTHRGR